MNTNEIYNECQSCKSIKIIEEFSNNSPDLCKDCYNKRHSLYKKALKKCNICQQIKPKKDFTIKQTCNECVNKKRCTRCKTIKQISEFGKLTNGKTRSECPSCWKIRCKEYEEKHKIKEKKCNRCSQTKPIELCCVRLPYCKTCYQIVSKERSKQYTIDHKDKYKQNGIEYRKKNPKKAMWMAAFYRAKKYNLPFDITQDDIVIPEKCPVLGITLSNGIGKTQDSSPSLDRIIPKLGYTKGNIMVISNRANVVKSFGSAEEHEKIAQYIKNT